MPGYGVKQSNKRRRRASGKRSAGSAQYWRRRKSSGPSNPTGSQSRLLYSRDDLRDGAPVKDLVHKVLVEVFRTGLVPGLATNQQDSLAKDIAEVVRRQAVRAKNDILTVQGRR